MKSSAGGGRREKLLGAKAQCRHGKFGSLWRLLGCLSRVGGGNNHPTSVCIPNLAGPLGGNSGELAERLQSPLPAASAREAPLVRVQTTAWRGTSAGQIKVCEMRGAGEEARPSLSLCERGWEVGHMELGASDPLVEAVPFARAHTRTHGGAPPIVLPAKCQNDL